MHLTRLAGVARAAASLWREQRAIAVMEFALGAPLLMTLGGYGLEVSNLAITNMRVSQYALQIADNASRIGVNRPRASPTWLRRTSPARCIATPRNGNIVLAWGYSCHGAQTRSPSIMTGAQDSSGPGITID